MINISGSPSILSQIIFKSNESRALQALLTLGEQLEGEVIESRSPEQLVVRLKGMQVLAQSTASLPSGKSLLFEVVKLQPQVELKIVTPDLTTASGREQYLKSLNVPIDAHSTTALSTFIESGILPSREQIVNLIAQFADLPSTIREKNAPVELFRMLNFLKTINLPVTEKTLSAVLLLLQHNINLGESIGNLDDTLIRLLRSKKTITAEFRSIRNVIAELHEQIALLIGKDEGGLPKVPLHQILSVLGIFYDRSIKDQLLKHAAKTNVIDYTNLKGLILQLLREINAQQSRTFDQSFEVLKENLNKVLEHLESAQIFYSTKSEVNHNYISYIPIPVFFEGKPKTAHAIFQRRRTAKKKSDYWKVHLSIDLDHVGLLFLSLSGLKNFLSLRFICPDEKYMNFLREETKILPSLLQPLGYSLQNISTEVVQTTADAWYFLIGESLYESNKTIDIKI